MNPGLKYMWDFTYKSMKVNITQEFICNFAEELIQTTQTKEQVI